MKIILLFGVLFVYALVLKTNAQIIIATEINGSIEAVSGFEIVFKRNKIGFNDLLLRTIRNY